MPVIKQTITEIPKGLNYFAEFMRLNKDIVTVTEEGTATTDYPNAVVSAGPLVPPALTVTQDEESRALTFTMSTTDTGFYCNEDDTVHVAILSAGKRMRLLTKELGGRGDGGMTTAYRRRISSRMSAGTAELRQTRFPSSTMVYFQTG